MEIENSNLNAEAEASREAVVEFRANLEVT